MRLGVLLPTFRATPKDALAAAAQAEAAGLDGVFAYDHVWPMGHPERPALAPFEVLAAVATRHERLVVGPLVARVGLVDDDVLLSQCRALRVVADGRVVQALGTGDHLSREENLAYGVGVAAPEARRASLEAVARALRADGDEVWIGAGAAATREIAAATGATLNVWDADAEAVARLGASGPISWAGPAPGGADGADAADTRVLVAALAGAGATWAVFAPQVPIALVASCRDAAGA